MNNLKPTLSYKSPGPVPIPTNAKCVWVVWLHIEQQWQLFNTDQKELAEIFTTKEVAEQFVAEVPTINTPKKRTYFTIEQRELKETRRSATG